MPDLPPMKDWPARSIKMRPLAELIPNARNARQHSDEQVESIAASMREFGWTIPVLIDEAGAIIAGHGRVLAAELLKIKKAPTMIAAGWTEAQKRAYAIADNKLTIEASWDDALLATEIKWLQENSTEIDYAALTGFGVGEIEQIFAGLDGGGGSSSSAGALADRFGAVPFSVLNAREGWWQNRKAAWLSLGIESELGRGDNLLKFSDTVLEPDPAKRGKKKAAADGK